jgi:hypothetical protein
VSVCPDEVSSDDGVETEPACASQTLAPAAAADSSTTTLTGKQRRRADSANPRWERNKKPKKGTPVDKALGALPTEGVQWTEGMLKNLEFSFFEWCDNPSGAGYVNLTWRSNIVPVFKRAVYNINPYEDQLREKKEYYFYGNLSMLPDRGDDSRWCSSTGRPGAQWFSTFWQWLEKYEPHRLPVIRTKEGYTRLTYKVLQEGVDGRHDGRKFTMMLKAFYEYAEVRALGRLRAQGHVNPWAALAGDHTFAAHLSSMQGAKARQASAKAKTSLAAAGSGKKKKRQK